MKNRRLKEFVLCACFVIPLFLLQNCTDVSSASEDSSTENTIHPKIGRPQNDPSFKRIAGLNIDGNGGTKKYGGESSYVFFEGRKVKIPSFYFYDHEVTQAEWVSVMQNNPSHFKNSPATDEVQSDRPVESISWFDGVIFCNKLSVLNNLEPCYYMMIDGKKETNTSKWGTPPACMAIDGASEYWNKLSQETRIKWAQIECDFSKSGYRLPAQAEWECVAACFKSSSIYNNSYCYSGSSELNEIAWYSFSSTKGNSDNMTHEVKKKKANDYGIYDLCGNVYEWCWDSNGGPAKNTPMEDEPHVGYEINSLYRIARGGGYCQHNKTSTKDDYKISQKTSFPALYKAPYIGLRLVATDTSAK